MRHLYILFLLTTFSFQLQSQCNVPFEPNIVFDEQLMTFCEGLDEFCSILPDQYTFTELPGCDQELYSIHNAHVLEFVASDVELVLEIIPFFCNGIPGETGIQAVLYAEEAPLTGGEIPIAMNCGTGYEEAILLEADLDINCTYYLLIDGWSGEVCEYVIYDLNMATVAPSESSEHFIVGPHAICSGAEFTYEALGGPSCGYEWSVVGGEIVGNSNSSSVHVIADDDIQTITMCVTSFNSCHILGDTCFFSDVVAPFDIDSTVVDSICVGDVYVFGGEVFTQPGQYSDTVQVDCERIHIELTLLEKQPTIGIDSARTCAGGCVSFNGEDFCQEGVYEVLLESVNGCDSIVTFYLYQDTIPSTEIFEEICEGEVYDWDGEIYNQAGVYSRLFDDFAGCDSAVVLHLSVFPALYLSSVGICQGDNYFFEGMIYSESTYIEVPFTATNGCDSIRAMSLTVEPLLSGNIHATICEGDTFFYGTTHFTQAGNYQYIVENESSCDSVIFIQVEVNLSDNTSVDTTMMIGDIYNDFMVSGDTILIDIFEGQNSCDSIVTTTIKVITSSVAHEHKRLQFYPNPARSYLIVKGTTIQVGDLQIIDTHGISRNPTMERDHNQVRIDVDFLSAGVYFILYDFEGKREMHKFIKM